MGTIDSRVNPNRGDVVYIKTDKPVLGLIFLTDFIDLVVDESIGTYTKEFRYSFDSGGTWSSWNTLTKTNIENVTLEPTQYFEAEYIYLRTDLSPDQNITLDGEFIPDSCGYGYANSIFNQFFGCHDLELLNWCLNITEKLYKSGIVPNYLERDEELSFSSDKDYIDYWRTIACFFAYFVIFSRQFANFSDNISLLREFLTQRGLYYCNDDALADLQYMMKNYYDEIRKRGTRNIYQQYNGVNGELLRMVCYGDEDEFLFDLTQNKNIGWNIANSSPLFRGVHQHLNLNKSYEYTEDFVNLSKYPIINDSYVSITTDGNKDVLDISGAPSGEVAGIGNSTETDKYITVNPYLNYEITFWIKHNVIGDNFTFECYGYDKNDNQIDLLNNQDGNVKNDFFTAQALSRNDKYYFVRGIIYNVDQNDISGETTSLKVGNHLRFQNTDTVKILPRILLDNDTGSGSDQIYIHDLKIKPVSVNFSKGFLQTSNFIINFVQYNNDELTKETFEEKVRKYLIPYNAIYKPQYLEQGAITGVAVYFVTFNINDDGELTYNNDNDTSMDFKFNSDGELIADGQRAPKYSINSDGEMIYKF